MATRADDQNPSDGDSLFAAWVARHDAREKADFEALCREHPLHTTRLCTLHAHWDELEAIRRHHGLDGSLSERLKSHYGSGVNPQVTLEGEEQLKGDFSSEVLSRLAGRGPASTRYRVKGEVAHGGMGAVLRVWDEDLRRHLAMKVMLGRKLTEEHSENPQTGSRSLARFLEEAQVTSQLDHPGIVPVHELGLDSDGRVYFTMKLVKGKTLKDVFDELAGGKGGWTQTRILGLILKVCEAMRYAHAKGVIHRDLKPTNVMIGGYGEVFVMDWGLARILGREDQKNIRIREEPEIASSAVHSLRHELGSGSQDSPLYTMDGDVVGTPAYMSPEQAAGDLRAMGPHSDVYAVGAMLYHLLAGHSPYAPPEVRVNNHAIWYRVQAGPPTSLHELTPHAPQELVAICDRAMARDVPARYSDMSALAGDLSAYVEGRVVHAYETGAWAEARKWVRRNRPLAASLLAAVVVLVVGLVSSLLLKAKSDANAEESRLNARRADAKAQEAEANLELAQQNEVEAKAQRAQAESERSRAEEIARLARAETAKVLRLSDVKVLQELEADADKLWPPHPDRISAMESWLERARALVSRLAGHRQTLAEMRKAAHPWSGEERAQDRATNLKAAELAEKQAELAGLVAQLERGLQGEARETADRRVTELEPEVEALAAEVEARRTWSFDTAEEQWQHDVLTELVGNLEGLAGGLLVDEVITADHGWSVPKRLAFAQKLAAGSGEGGEYAQAWSAAVPAIREAYPGLDLKPQVGLLPIGPDPASGLWEFAHLMTGEPAERGPDGKLRLTGDTGVVLVLLRGGNAWIGAQLSDANGRNFDPQAQSNEAPVHEVELSPFLISKYELTQGQWLRLVGRNPSELQQSSAGSSLLLPVESVSWLDCISWMPRAGLMLPSEAQWEYGARGGTDTPWWTGADRESLKEQKAANLADQSLARTGASWTDIADWPELDDGFAQQAPVGSTTANAFGLHEVHGNLWEWCLDTFNWDFYGRSPKSDPVSPLAAGATRRVIRGGSYAAAAMLARSANRNLFNLASASNSLGFRPARAIDP
jgi:serine/threonine protein kinase/formylglycine-generating enzyme required for sulfatase activity